MNFSFRFPSAARTITGRPRGHEPVAAEMRGEEQELVSARESMAAGRADR